MADNTTEDIPSYFSAADIAALSERTQVHQFNEQAVRHMRTLGTRAGLTRIGLHMVRLEQGAYSTEFHTHDNDEEFVVVMAGRGVARVGEETFEVGTGDVFAFRLGSPAHDLHNPFEQDLVYLVGGEANSSDVVHYPNIERSMVKTAGRRYWTAWDAQSELPQKK